MKNKLLKLASASLAVTFLLSACSAPASNESKDATATAEQTTAANSSAPAADTNNPKVSIRIAHQANEKEATAQAFVKFKEVIEATNVGIDVTIFPAAQLVSSDRDSIEGLKLGEIDMTSVADLQFAPHVEQFYVFNADYLFDSLEKAREKLEGPAGEALIKAAADKNINCKVATFFGGSGRAFWNNVREVRKVEDFKGIKARTAENPINVAELTALGAIPTPMAWNELQTGLQQGSVDGLISSKSPILQQGIVDVLKYVTDTNHSYSINIILFNQKKYDAFTDAQKQAFDEAVKAATDLEWEIAVDEDKKIDDQIMELMSAGKITYTRLTDEERAVFKDAFIAGTETLVTEKCGAEILKNFR